MSTKQESEGVSTWWVTVKNFLKWFIQKENILMLLGASIALTAVAVPFAIIHFTKTSYTMKSFEDLGVIGDFFGGTTVGLLSLASIIFVTAAVMMQKEELKLQRKEVEKTRDEYKITNATMRKQQFDSTFFNMINLHHNILKEISFRHVSGRSAISLLFETVKEVYNGEVLLEYKKKLKTRILFYRDESMRNDFLLQSVWFNLKKEYILDIQQHVQNYIHYDEDGKPNDDRLSFKLLSVYTDKDSQWIRMKEHAEKEFNANMKKDPEYVLELLEEVDFEGLINAGIDHHFLDVFNKNTNSKPLIDLRIQSFEIVYNANENLIGHYYRNLYRIIRLIQDETFDIDEKNNEKEKKKYRGILRAQLSSFELMMIFYNVTYSKKGEKFKTYLINTNFFDDHLIQSDFIWANDKDELEKIN
ncbi:putative phage abortive infection protein [Paenibacillus xylanexedens]|uniref:Membrane protein n=1 Tax=Paenibacillus xylanexedens TaxID=528191 RepID=A0ABS4RLV5_PAEXY|nr:putative phage abortive infection protein [Paenibacillus xylanexedens]MBP2243877.1 putative membrane protein [Paenibacillus xylanexedens]